MKYLLAIACLLFAFSALAQNETITVPKGAPPPEARPFEGGGVKSMEAPKQQVGSKPKLRQPNVEIWLPPEFQSTEQKWPLLIFSHGFGGCAKQSQFLTSYLADHGYIVIAPDHDDSNCDRFAQGGLRSTLQAMRPGKSMRPEKPFRTPEVWTDKTEADRRDDVLFALSSMLDDRQYKNYVDLDKVGLIGHSLGGYTVLGLAGAWPSWKDKRFKAVLALSPFAEPYVLGRALSRINIPVMYQGGTKDDDLTPIIKKRGYEQTKAPKYYIELDGAGHFAWTQLDTDYQGIINETALQFFDKYVKGDKAAEILPEGADRPGKPGRKVKTFQKDEGLKN